MLKSHKELVVWQRAMELVKDVYGATSRLPQSEVYGLAAQMRRAAISIPSNISEGQKRKNRKEFAHFSRIAYGSASELETQLCLASELYPEISWDISTQLTDEVMRMLNVLVRKLETTS